MAVLSDWVQINGRMWDVLVMNIEESFNILYSENTGRTIEQGAPMTLDPLGSFLGHKVTFARNKDKRGEYDVLFDYLRQPRYQGLPIKIVHGQTTIEYDAYVSSGTRKLDKIDDEKHYVDWDEFEANFIPIRAQVIPSE